MNENETVASMGWIIQEKVRIFLLALTRRVSLVLNSLEKTVLVQ